MALGDAFHIVAKDADGTVFHSIVRRDGKTTRDGEWQSLGARSFTGPLVLRQLPEGEGLALFAFNQDRTSDWKEWNGGRWEGSADEWQRAGTSDDLEQPPRLLDLPVASDA